MGESDAILDPMTFALISVVKVFFWDDEIDCGTLTNDLARTDAYCDAALAFIKHHLQPELNVVPPVAGRLHNSGMWSDIGNAVQEGQSIGMLPWRNTSPSSQKYLAHNEPTQSLAMVSPMPSTHWSTPFVPRKQGEWSG
jgi:hypothetical protein